MLRSRWLAKVTWPAIFGLICSMHIVRAANIASLIITELKDSCKLHLNAQADSWTAALPVFLNSHWLVGWHVPRIVSSYWLATYTRVCCVCVLQIRLIFTERTVCVPYRAMTLTILGKCISVLHGINSSIANFF